MRPRDRRHFRAIAAALAADDAARLAEAMQKSPLERVIEGLELGRATFGGESEVELDERARGQALLQVRRRERERRDVAIRRGAASARK